MYIQLKYVACILFNKTLCIQEVVSKHCKGYSSYYCNVRSFFLKCSFKKIQYSRSQEQEMQPKCTEDSSVICQ